MTNDEVSRILVKAAFTNDVETISKYLDRDIPKDAKFPISYENNDSYLMVLPTTNLTLLHVAAVGDSLEVFTLLESYGFDIGCSSAASYLPIHYACLYSSYEVASYILAKKPEMAKSEPQVEFHLLYLTATGGDPGIMSLLFENNINLKSPANRRNNPFFKAVQSRNIECLKILLQHGERPPKNDEFTFPMYAAINLQPAAVEYLVENDENLISYCSPISHHTLLGLCCFTGQPFKNVILNLLKKATKIEPPSEIECQGPIHWMCTFIDLDVAHAFFRHAVNVNRLDQEGKTGFHYLIDKPKQMETKIIQLMQLIIDHGFNINIRRAPRPNSQQPPTVLEHFINAIMKSYNIIEFLIMNGADIYAENKNQKRLIDAVMEKKDKKLIEIFKKSPMYKPEQV